MADSGAELSDRRRTAMVMEIQCPILVLVARGEFDVRAPLAATKSPSCRLVGMAAVLAVLAAGLVLACDTPVYRYAMYRWEPAPYEVYFFHDKPMDEQAAQVQKLVEAASRAEKNPANLSSCLSR